jgi:hypothetical protein
MLSTSVPFVPIQYQSSSLAEFCLVKERDFARAVDMFERWGCESLKEETCMIGLTADTAHTDVLSFRVREGPLDCSRVDGFVWPGRVHEHFHGGQS